MTYRITGYYVYSIHIGYTDYMPKAALITWGTNIELNGWIITNKKYLFPFKY